MAEESDQNNVAELLKIKLAEQDELRKKFGEATLANSYKEEIDLDEKYRPITEFRLDKSLFIIKHTPTELLNQWSAMTGPRSLKRGVEGWVDEIHKTFPQKEQN